MSNSEFNSNTDVTDNSITKTTDLLCKHIEFLLQENTSKNTIIKILVENQQHASNTKDLVSSESFKTVRGAFIKNHYKPKSQSVVCNNRYDTLYPTDDSDESDSSKDAETLSSGSTSSNTSNCSNSKNKKRQHTKSRKQITRQQVKYQQRNIMKIMQYIRENIFRSKYKLTSPNIKIINRSVLPQKKKTQVKFKFVM